MLAKYSTKPSQIPKILRFITILIVAFGAGCDVPQRPNPAQVPSHVAEIDGVKSADVYMRMAAGELRVENQSLALMVAKYKYNTPIRIPKKNFEVEDGVGKLSLTQEIIPSIGVFARGDGMNEWEVHFQKDTPLNLHLEFGRGSAYLNLAGLTLKRFKLLNESGIVGIDLSTINLTDDLVLWIDNGDGDIGLKLPENYAVLVNTERGAEIVAATLIQDGDVYSKNANLTGPRIYINIKNIAGMVKLK